MSVKLSARAAKEVKKLITAGGLGQDIFLRLTVKRSGGCAPTCGLEFDNVCRKNDHFFRSRGVRLAVDGDDIPYLSGALIDWREEKLLSGFAVDIPNARHICGCQKSHQ